jgi:CBS domain-containing protein
MEVKEAMKQPYVIDKDCKLDKLADIMSSKNISSVIYVNKEKVVGIITEGDLIRNFHKSKSASDVMTKNVITISEESSLDEALQLMREHGIKKLPVIDEKSALTGILSLTDIAANVESLDEDFFFD